MPVTPVPRGLEQLIADEHQKLVGALALYVGDLGVAEELAHDALIRLCGKWAQVSAMESPKGWLYAVAFNLARSRWRRLSAERRAGVRVSNRPSSTGRDEAGDVERVITVRSAVASLPPRQRMVVILRYFDDLSVADTASIMKCAPGTVKSLTSQALASLQPALGLDANDRDGSDVIPTKSTPSRRTEHV